MSILFAATHIDILQFLSIALLLSTFLQVFRIKSLSTFLGRVQRSLLFAWLISLLVFIGMVITIEIVPLDLFLIINSRNLPDLFHSVQSEDMILLILVLEFVLLFVGSFHNLTTIYDIRLRLLQGLLLMMLATIFLIPMNTIQNQNHLQGLFQGIVLSLLLFLFIIAASFCEHWSNLANDHPYITGTGYYLLGLFLLIVR